MAPGARWINLRIQQKDWFQLHKIEKMDPAYVVSVKFADIARVYVTGTTTGEVKIWDSRECQPLGTLNSMDPRDGWRPRRLLDNIGTVRRAKKEAASGAYVSKKKKLKIK